MSEFDLVGYDRKEHFERHLEPERLGEELERYQEIFEMDFGVKELLELEKIKAFEFPTFYGFHAYVLIIVFGAV